MCNRAGCMFPQLAEGQPFPSPAEVFHESGPAYRWKDAELGYGVIERAATEPGLVLVREGTGGVFPDGTTNHPPIDSEAWFPEARDKAEAPE